MSDAEKAVLPTILVMFGATGDLVQRKILPALWQLYDAGQLPPLFQVVGYSRQQLTDAAWQERVEEIVREKAGEVDKTKLTAFAKLFVYESGLFEDLSTYKSLAGRLGRQDDQWRTCANKLFYLAVPPRYYETIFRHLADSGLTEPCSSDDGWTRVIVEKPFGKDLATAQSLDELLGTLFKEEQVYRVDHYLGKDTVRNILAFRFSNTFLDPAWDSRSIDNIRIQFLEEQGVQGRGSFYDGIGALRDVGQNHLLQLLALFTMENPGTFDAESIREKRHEVLEALEIMDEQDVARLTVRGQYDGYRKIEGVEQDSQTETYFRVQTQLNSTRWRGVPIYLEGGKSMNESRVEVTLTFRHKTPCLCPSGKHYTNVLRYRIQPHEGIFMSFWVKKPGPDMVIEEKDFSFDYHHAYHGGEFIEPYAKLLRDAIEGDQTLFVSTPEIIASWRFVDPIVRAWEKGVVPLKEYDVGGEGPALTKDLVGTSPARSKRIGYIGLGKMGSNMVERLVDYDWQVVATDPNEQARAKIEAIGVESVAEAAQVVKQLESPRLVWLMVPHQVVEEVISEIVPYLVKGDTVIDGGNSFYKESVRRAAELAKRGIYFLDVGVSGGPSGAREGACLMVGGEREVYKQQVGLFGDLSVAAGFDYMGVAGAGHFVKMVHNGIEYGIMQALAEGFAVMKKSRHKLDLERVAHLFNHGSVIESSLVGWLKDAYAKYGVDLDEVTGRVAHSGEGQWTVDAAKELGIPVPIIAGALQFRIGSEERPSYTGQVLSGLRNQFGGHDAGKRQR